MKKYILTVFLLSFVSCIHTQGQVLINEVCPANADINYDPDFFGYSGWVELLNKSSTSVDVGGFYLSDDPDLITKWRIPSGTTIAANSYRLIWCDGKNSRLHTNFELDAEGEELFLYNRSLALVDHIVFPQQYTNVSYGRTPDGETTIGFLSIPTPAAKNNSSTGTTRLANPDVSLKSGRYSGMQTVSITHPGPGTIQLRYTTDGSEPGPASQLYTNSLTIQKTSTLKVKAFAEGYLPSKTEVKTYFINFRAFTLPVVSLSMKPDYLWNNTIGIYTDGSNGISGNCTDQPRNWNQDWDRHAVFELFDNTGSKILDQSVDIRIGGACSRGNPQKSFVVRARDKYGSNTIEHDFFKSKMVNEYGSLILRNSGNDFWHTMFRDAMQQTLPIGKMDIDYLAYQPASVFINGDYWGILNLREKIDGDYIESNYGVKKNDLDIVETWMNAVEGSSDHYQNYLGSLRSMDRSKPEAFEFIDSHIDVQEYINYLVMEIYCGNTDWPGNNVKFWRQRSTNGKYRWILWDMDFGFGLYDWAAYPTHPTLDFATDPDNTEWPNPASTTEHIRLVLENPEFRKRFIQTMTASLGTTFRPSRVVSIIDSFQENIRAEMPYHTTRWSLSMDNWTNEVERLRQFAGERYVYMQEHIRNYFQLGDNVRFSTNVYPAGAGAVVMNGITSSEPVVESPYYKGLGFELAPAPSPGYQFSHWIIKKQDVTPISLINKNETWRYFDEGTLPSSDWTMSSYSDASWAAGEAELGYGDGDEKTVVSFGGVPATKHITTYFRKVFTVADTVGFEALAGKVLYDDGVVLYLNGIEVYRGNMPGGLITNSTLSAQNVSSETAFFSFVVPKGILKNGENILAAEVHQNSATSSDISFNLELSTYKIGQESVNTLTDVIINDIAGGDVIAEAYFVDVLPKEGIIINELSAVESEFEDDFNQTEDWIELYNSGSAPVDIAGFYITDNLSNKIKHLIGKGKNNETVIEPGQYKILWADEDVTQGPLHVNFKLSSGGESVGIYQKVGNAILKVDEVTFGKQYDISSWSRIPDITGPFVLTAKQTPGISNIFEIPTSTEESVSSVVTIFPNPTNGIVMFQTEKPITSVSIFSSTGVLLQQLNGNPVQIEFTELPSGLYTLLFQLGSVSEVKRIIKR